MWWFKVGRNILTMEVALRSEVPSPTPGHQTRFPVLGRKVPITLAVQTSRIEAE